ncbi:hexb1 [Symbiodinium microadriaticum]|nr:hexb1 [Symbiodinium microadriaticum]
MYAMDPQFNISSDKAHLVLGGEGCMWGETVDPSDMEATVWPRAAAIAERLWSAPGVNSTEAAEPRLLAFRCMLLARGVRTGVVEQMQAGLQRTCGADGYESYRWEARGAARHQGPAPAPSWARTFLMSLPRWRWKGSSFEAGQVAASVKPFSQETWCCPFGTCCGIKRVTLQLGFWEAPKAAGDVEDEFFRLTGIRPDPVVIPKKEKPKEPPPEPPRPSFKERVVRDLLDRQHTRSPPRAPSHPDLHMAKKRRRGAEGVAAEVEAEDVQDVQPQPRRKAKRKKAAMPESAAKDDGCLAPSTARAFEEPTRKAKRKKAVKVQPAAKATEFSAEAQAVMEELTDPASKGTLSDRLNPTHPRYDKQLKARWKSFSKKERAAIVECDKNKMKATVSAAVSIQHPFATNEDDHCETALEAYRDVLPILQHIASLLGKAPSKLRIYDPFYCAGAVVKHLGELGFPHVYNKCEDFYAVNEEGRVPKHDVLLTNPPYSGEHVEYLLRFCRSNAKPFLLLMPNYFCSKDFYDDALGGTSQSVLYLCPRKRYFYWTPKGLRTRSKVQSQHAGEGGNRTSPFISFWYIDLSPLMSAKALMRWWQETRGGEGSKLCRRPDLPRSCQP